jgi:hypothetical protein
MYKGPSSFSDVTCARFGVNDELLDELLIVELLVTLEAIALSGDPSKGNEKVPNDKRTVRLEIDLHKDLDGDLVKDYLSEFGYYNN